jgi:hypothetical protein
MIDRMDAKLNALTTELASSAPLPPPMPPLDPRPKDAIVGPTTAVAVFAGIIVVAGLALAGWMRLSSAEDSVSASEAFETTGASPVAVVTKDGETLGGYFWRGGPTGTLIVSAYGSDPIDLLPLATSAHAKGSTVMLLEPRGQGRSEGERRVDLLVSDIDDAVRDLSTRGVDRVILVGVRHTATAAIAASVDPPDIVASTIAFFPFEQYQGIDAIGVIADTRVPIIVVGASAPSYLGPWAGHLAAAASEGVQGILLPPLPPEAGFREFYLPEMRRILTGQLD